MKRLSFAFAAALAIAACGGGATSASPSAAATTARATTTPSPSPSPVALVFKADLKPAAEVPPVTDAEASCSGTATLTLKDTSKTADIDIEIKGCPASAAVNLGMVHQGAAGANGPVKIDFMKAGDLSVTAGAGKLSKTNLAVDPAVFADIVANPGGWYVNLHSTLHGGGVMRGQLTKA